MFQWEQGKIGDKGKKKESEDPRHVAGKSKKGKIPPVKLFYCSLLSQHLLQTCLCCISCNTLLQLICHLIELSFIWPWSTKLPGHKLSDSLSHISLVSLVQEHQRTKAWSDNPSSSHVTAPWNKFPQLWTFLCLLTHTNVCVKSSHIYDLLDLRNPTLTSETLTTVYLPERI